jgi:hypothetical protein
MTYHLGSAGTGSQHTNTLLERTKVSRQVNFTTTDYTPGGVFSTTQRPMLAFKLHSQPAHKHTAWNDIQLQEFIITQTGSWYHLLNHTTPHAGFKLPCQPAHKHTAGTKINCRCYNQTIQQLASSCQPYKRPCWLEPALPARTTTYSWNQTQLQVFIITQTGSWHHLLNPTTYHSGVEPALPASTQTHCCQLAPN